MNMEFFPIRKGIEDLQIRPVAPSNTLKKQLEPCRTATRNVAQSFLKKTAENITKLTKKRIVPLVGLVDIHTIRVASQIAQATYTRPFKDIEEQKLQQYLHFCLMKLKENFFQFYQKKSS